MKITKPYLLLLILGLLNVLGFSQETETFKSKFEEANVLMEDKYYPYALDIWLELLKEQPDNSNVNYKVGLCYYHSPTHQAEGIPYFKKAIKNITNNYDPYMYTENNAKPDAYFYYAHALHIDYQLDSAIFYFKKFQESVNKKHLLQSQAARQIEMCITAKELMKTPDDVIIKNLGTHVNSKYAEHSPVISLDESEIFFTSRRLRKDSANLKTKEISTNKYFEDVYVSYKDKNGDWTDPLLLNFNRYTTHQASIALSADQQTLFLYHDDEGDGNIYQSFLFGERWSKPEKMESINSKYNETHLTISVDGKTLYFTSDRKGGLGGKDIYSCKKLPTGDWGEPRNLGPNINTPYDEESPFFHADGNTLYFSSQGHQSMGGYDIFYTEIDDSGNWGKPMNIGYPINSTHDDIFYSETPDGLRAYYASYGGEGNVGEKDIYLIEQRQQPEKALTLLKGHVRAPDGQELPEGTMVYLTDNETGLLVGEAKPLQRTGSYVFIIPPGKNYNVSYEVNGQEFYNENIFVPLGSEYNEISKEILLDPMHLTGEEIKEIKENLYVVEFKKLKSDKGKLTMKCVNDQGKIIFEQVASKDGTFSFSQLPENRNYMLQFFDEDGNMVDCEGEEIELFKNGNSHAVLLPNNDCLYAPVKDSKVGRVSFVNLPSIPEKLLVQYVDDEGNAIFTEAIDSKGYFYFHTIATENLKMKLIGDIPCEETNIQIVDKETGEKIFTELQSTNDCDFIPLQIMEEKDTETVSIEKPSFQEFFGYNKNESQDNKKLSEFIAKTVEIAKTEGAIKIAINSSASKVPTRTYPSNEALAKLRAENMKAKLIKLLSEKGINSENINFISMSTLVLGPAYKGDYLENKSTYEQYQYVKVEVK